jgi:hypothetical protein
VAAACANSRLCYCQLLLGGVITAALQTIKSLLSAVGLEDSVYGIPNYSCVLAVELLNDGDKWAVRLMFQNGPGDVYKVSAAVCTA